MSTVTRILSRPAVAESAQAISHSRIRELAEVAMTMDGVLKLYFGESNLPTPAFIKDAATKALADGHTYYTSNAGTPSLREALAAHYQRLHQVRAGPGDRVRRHRVGRAGPQPVHSLLPGPGRRSHRADPGVAQRLGDRRDVERRAGATGSTAERPPLYRGLRGSRERGRSAHAHAAVHLALESSGLGGHGGGAAEAARVRQTTRPVADRRRSV